LSPELRVPQKAIAPKRSTASPYVRVAETGPAKGSPDVEATQTGLMPGIRGPIRAAVAMAVRRAETNRFLTTF
jgi:hypothetical protein